MSTNFDALASDALSLPPEQRIVLAQRLWDSIEGYMEEDDELLSEIDRRVAELDSGAVKTYSHEEVMQRLRKVLGE